MPTPVITRRGLIQKRFRGKRIGVVKRLNSLMLGGMRGHDEGDGISGKSQRG
jgi:hypothetical protein